MLTGHLYGHFVIFIYVFFYFVLLCFCDLSWLCSGLIRGSVIMGHSWWVWMTQCDNKEKKLRLARYKANVLPGLLPL